jgi:hypothetical protein
LVDTTLGCRYPGEPAGKIKWLTSQSFLTKEEHQMAPAVEELPSGQPTGNSRHPRPYRRPARRVRKIDFAQLDDLGMRADQELRETEDALIAFIEQQEKRDRLYVKSQEELKERFQFGRMGGVA